MLFVQVSLQKWLGDKGNPSEIESAYQLHCHLHSATSLDWAAVTKFKTAKTNSEGFL
jgi:hypothetical protein